MTSSRHGVTRDSPIEQLFKHPYRFEFFQAVRLLSLASSQREGSSGHRLKRPVGMDWLPHEELVRFRASVANTFCAGQIASLDAPHGPVSRAGHSAPPEMTVDFMGLAGAEGVLPVHYTQMLIDRTRAKDFSLRDFLDLFNHRLISHFYRAWQKCHFYVGYEIARREEPPREDLFTSALYSLIGQGTDGLRGRQDIPDESFLYYAGHFARFPRTATSLERMLNDYFDVSASVCQFQGQWMYLRPSDQTRLTSSQPRPSNSQLGVSAIAGERIWGVENKIRIRLGPLDYVSFRRYMPSGDRFKSLAQLTRSYVGASLDVDLQLVLRRDEIPPCVLQEDAPIQLGWNAWLFGAAPQFDVDDAVFEAEGAPNR